MNYLILAANGILLAATAFKFNRLPPVIPLFYTRSPLDAQLTPWWMIFILPLSMNIFYLLNKKLATTFFANNNFVSQFLQYLNIIIIVSFAFIFLKILFLIT